VAFLYKRMQTDRCVLPSSGYRLKCPRRFSGEDAVLVDTRYNQPIFNAGYLIVLSDLTGSAVVLDQVSPDPSQPCLSDRLQPEASGAPRFMKVSWNAAETPPRGNDPPAFHR